MSKEDQDKMTFVTSQGLYCYKVLHFGLKNVRATYQSKTNAKHLDDLRETFNTLQKYKMKLNPMKCAFGVS